MYAFVIQVAGSPAASFARADTSLSFRGQRFTVRGTCFAEVIKHVPRVKANSSSCALHKPLRTRFARLGMTTSATSGPPNQALRRANRLNPLKFNVLNH